MLNFYYMKLLIKQAKIVDSSSPFNGLIKDILIVDGIINSIEDSTSILADKVVQEENLHISTGWTDIFAHFCDPGYEYKETLETGAAAAAAGGFTDVMILPNTNPVVGSKSQVEYIVQKSKYLPVTIHPIGAITKNTEGKELTEMYDMQQSGAIAFSDGINSIQSPGILLKALQYLTAVNGTIIQIPDDKTISPQGLINEGIISTQLGLPGKPSIAEELMIARDIELVRYTNATIHFTGVSTQKSIELIAKAKSEGLNITCSTTPYHLLFNDEDLITYDTNLKVNPPIRNKTDMMALRSALQNGTIDCIASHHIPQNKDNKICEFENAKNGMIGLETLYGVIAQILTIERCIDILTVIPRNIFGLPEIKIVTQSPAKLTLFIPDNKYTYEENIIRSKSKNSALIGKELTGKVIGIVNGNNIVLN